MKKLNLLKPNKKKIYLNNGKGQVVEYLQISPNLDINKLKSDIKNGAVHFKEIESVAEKKPSRVVVITCDNEEQGLMAVSYLASIYNKSCDECEENIKVCEDAKEWDMYDFEEREYETIDHLYGEDDYEDDEDFGDGWVESANRLPIIRLAEIRSRTNEFSQMPFGDNDMVFSGIAPNVKEKPYWFTTKKEPVCIIDNRINSFSNMYTPPVRKEDLERFADNRHLYILSITNEEQPVDSVFGMGDTDIYRQNIYEIILEYTALLVEMKISEEELKKYYGILFDNWAGALGVTNEKDVPKHNIIKLVMAMFDKNKSALIEKIYKYVLSQDGVTNILTQKDFAIIDKFKNLGYDTEDKQRTSIKKMENTLIGLEEVKEQVYGIVDVMKYNKQRKRMGYSSNNFHNVHLMIGAPGTAKTTIAKLMGDIMVEQKLLSGNRFVSINGAELKGMYVGHSAPKTKAYFDNNDIILIDEAYSVTSGKDDMDSFSQEAIAQLIIELEKHANDKLIIFAGYGGPDVDAKDNKMLQFLEANPGIKSRINSTIYFKSYTPDEMVKIVHCQAKNNEYILGHEADELIRKHFEKRYRLPDFGNGREARSMVENISLEAARRVMRMNENRITKRTLARLVLSDVEAAIKKIENSYNMQNGNSDNKIFGFT